MASTTTTAGQAQFRGGRGVVLDYRVLVRVGDLTINFGRYATPPWGMDGGRTGSGNYSVIVRADGT